MKGLIVTRSEKGLFIELLKEMIVGTFLLSSRKSEKEIQDKWGGML
ncbi:hypothetical protein [Ornithinibacillus sp. JPR2-1]